MKSKFPPPDDKAIFLEHFHGYDLYIYTGPIPDLISVGKKGIIARGFEQGRTGENLILAYAYGLAKVQGHYIDIAEQEFLLNSAIGWLVVGVTGLNADREKWPAFFTLNKTRATQVAMLLNKQANLWAQTRKSEYEPPPYGWSQLDPNMKCDYTGTEYSLMPIKHESDPNRISFALEVCPECNSQVYETSNGSICERGHMQ